MDDALRARVAELCAEGWRIWEQLDVDVRGRAFHPFVAADYEGVLAALLRHRGTGLRFLEWGSASGVITIMADMLGFEAYGIELDESLELTRRGPWPRNLNRRLALPLEVFCQRAMCGAPSAATVGLQRSVTGRLDTASSAIRSMTSMSSSATRGAGKSQ